MADWRTEGTGMIINVVFMYMKNRFVKIIHILLLGVAILNMVIAFLLKPIWLMEYVTILSIIAFTLFALEILVCHFGNTCASLISYCRSKFLILSGDVADKLEQYSKQLKALQSKSESLSLLAPRIVDKSEYVSILKSAIDDEDVRNVAISGPYGSGKSSIIKTFEKNYPKYKCLNLSLAAFAEEFQSLQNDSNSDGKSRGNKANGEGQSFVDPNVVKMEQLEFSLVQQFFYHVKASGIPDSRFGRIRRWNRTEKVVWSIAILLFAFSLFYVVDSSKFFDLLPSLKVYTDGLRYLSLGVIGTGLFVISYRLVTFFHKMSGGHIKFMDYEVDVQKDIKVSVFNRYLDELVYLFQTTGYQVVVLEDLDRFKNTSIYTKLRELNQLLNQSEDIGRRIVFVYALRDDIFHTSQERTKFFDYIIPVLPHTSVANSSSQFVKELGTLVGDSDDECALHKSFLNDVAPFIGDLRTIKAIVSDFKITSKRLNSKLKKDNLLAIIIYKNLCPKDFELIFEGKGPIHATFSKESEYKKKKKEELKEKKDSIENKIKEVKEERLISVNELNSIVVSAAIKLIPAGYYICNSGGNQIAYADLFSDDYVQNILKGKLYYRNNYSGIVCISKEKVLSLLGDEFNYEYRKTLIEQNSSVSLRKLTEDRDACIRQLDNIVKKTMREMCELDETLLSTQTEDDNTNLLNFLIRRGYIDESYYYYITDIKSDSDEEGLLSQNDNAYLLSVKGIGVSDEDEMSRHIDDPKLLLKFLIPQDFVGDKILNFDLVHEIIQSKNDKTIELLKHKLKSQSDYVLDFINRYAFLETAKDGFIPLVAQQYDNLWADVENNSLFSNEAKLNLFNKLMKYAPINDLKKQNEDGLLAEYLRKSYYTNTFDGVQTNKARLIIENFNVRFLTLVEDRDTSNLLDFVYKNDYYAHNSENIWTILKSYSDINVHDYVHSIYTALIAANIEPLLSQISEGIDSFVSCCLLADENTLESTESITLLLNNSNVSEETKKKIISHNSTLFEDIQSITSAEYKNTLFECNKVKPSLANIDYYLTYNNLTSLDEIIVQYINNNVQEYIELLKKQDIIQGERQIIKCLIASTGIDEDIWKTIFSEEKYSQYWNDDVLNLLEEQISFLVDNKLLRFDVVLFKAIGAKFKDIFMHLLCKYSADVVENLPEFNFTTESLTRIASQKGFEEYITNIYALITADKIKDESIADSYLNYVIEDAAHLDFESLKKSVSITSDDKLKMKSVSAYMQQDFMTDANLSTLLISMGEPFSLIVRNQGDIFELDRSAEAYQFFEQLVARKFATPRDASKNKYKIYILKRH